MNSLKDFKEAVWELSVFDERFLCVEKRVIGSQRSVYVAYDIRNETDDFRVAYFLDTKTWITGKSDCDFGKAENERCSLGLAMRV